ncbi:hypothetical protein C8R45DRAFT_321833 [Mycena sanguinolenta]|nr:hypothetical protein C8R45DRAFT_321833 [Mycena sanguinolenta]
MHHNMVHVPVSNAFEEIVDSTQASASASTGLLQTKWEASATGTGYGYSYGYDSQPNQYLATFDFSTSILDFDAYNFGNNLSWPDAFVSNDIVPSASIHNYDSPMIHDAAQLFPATSFPQIPASFLAPSSLQSAPVVDAPASYATSSATTSILNYQPPILPNAAQFFPPTSLPQLPTNLQAESFFPIAPAVDAPSTGSRKRKAHDETDTDLVDMRAEGSEAL